MRQTIRQVETISFTSLRSGCKYVLGRIAYTNATYLNKYGGLSGTYCGVSTIDSRKPLNELANEIAETMAANPSAYKFLM